jgi:RHS repeat-associated protein
VDVRAPGTSGPNGSGVYQYQWYRDGQLVTATFNPELSDATVSAGSTHTYGVNATDVYGNTSATTSFTITTPASANVDPIETGVRSTGSYWGGMGEQIDVRSGNLNYSYPVLTAVSRGFSVPLALTYNSQNWFQDTNGNSWNLGTDTGIGYGWQLQIGSVTPYYSSTWDIAFYEFRDASGAAYRLDQNNNDIWTSTDSTYVSFDAQQNILHFNDGSRWWMWSTSGGLEPDAGSMYPYYLEDSNGNMVTVSYYWMNGAPTSRISQIYDARTQWYQETYDINYDSSGHLSSITNNIGSGESFTFNFSSPGTLSSPFGSSTQFGSMETLNSITNSATNLTTSFSWDPSEDGELTQVVFPYGGYIRWQYGSIAYAQATIRNIQNRYLLWDNTIGERSFTLSYALGSGSQANGTTTLTDQQAQSVKFWGFDSEQDGTQGLIVIYRQYGIGNQGHGIQRQVQYSWAQDPARRNYIGRTRDIANPITPFSVTKQIDQVMDQYGNVTQTKLYAYNNLVTPAKTYTNTYLSDPNYTSLYIYNRLVSSTVTDASGNTTTLVTNVYDGSALTNADVWTWSLDFDFWSTPRGNVTSSTSFGQTVNTQYDITGSVVYTDDGNPNHGLTIANSSAVDYSAPAAVTTANSMTTTFNWNASVAPLSMSGPNGDTASTTYDPSTAQPASSTSPYGAVTTYAYNTTAPQIVATVNGGQWTQTFLDGLGRTSRIAKGNGNTTVSYTDTVYDACGCAPVGKPYKASVPYAPGSTPAWKVNTYDALGRTLSTVAPDGSSTVTYSYLGNKVTVTDAAGNWKQYVTDAFGELIQVIEESPNPSVEPNHVTNYTYDILGHLIQVQMQRTVNGQVVTQTRSWTYDPNTQLLTQTSTPEAGITQLTYNSDGTLATKTDAKNQQIQYSYDPYGRVIQISRGTLVNGQFVEDVTQRTTLAYDGTNGGFSANTAGRLSQVNYAGPDGLQFTEWYSYLAAGAVTAKQLTVSGTALGSNIANLNATYAYNSLGQVTTVQYPFAQWSNGSVVTGGPQYGYTYDAMNRLNGMTGPSNQTLVRSVSYGPANQVLQLNASSFTETRTYNANLQLTSLVSGAYHYNYNYSATQNNGRIQSVSDAVSGETVAYQYDSLNRLIQASGTGDAQGAWSQAFTFDGFGNLTQKTGSNAPSNALLATNPANNQLTANGAQYDGNGNLTAYGTGAFAASYAYDIENRMSVATGAGTVESLFGYDQENQRVYQGSYDTSAGVYSNELIYFYGADGKKLGCWSLSASGGNYTLTATATNVWFAGRLLTAEDREQSIGKYFPFGEDRVNPNPPNPANNQEKFATYTRDSATGLDYAYQRYYNSQLGRFHTPDPYRPSAQMTKPQSWNRYGYVQNDPVNGNDPSGLFLSASAGSGAPGGDFFGDPFDCDELSGLFDDDKMIGTPASNCGGGPMIGLVYYGGGGGGGSSLIWSSLGAECQNALQTAMPKTGIPAMLAALGRAQDDYKTFQTATQGTQISATMLAAIAIRESGVQDVNEQDGAGVGVGVFQITVTNNNQNPAKGPTVAEADNLEWAADYAAQLLNSNMAYLGKKFPNYTPTQLLQATAASYNMNPYKPGNFTGNPGTIDIGTTGNNYGSNILQLMSCFH